MLDEMSIPWHWAPHVASLSPLYVINKLPCRGIKASKPLHQGYCLLNVVAPMLPFRGTKASSCDDILINVATPDFHIAVPSLPCCDITTSVLIFFVKSYTCSLNYYDMLDVLSDMYFSLFLRENAYNAKNRVFLTRNGKRKALSIRGILKTWEL